MTDVPIFLAFPDALLRYECHSCDQRCCKTGGLPVFPAEHERLIAMHPALELVAPARAGGIEIFATPPSGCWFLEDTACSLGHGSDTAQNVEPTPPRPSACTLFPFNLFGILGDALVVAPNGICPLWVEPGAGVSHASILELLGTVGAAGAPPVTLRAEGHSLLPLEVMVRDAAQASVAEPSPLPLVAFTTLATQAFVGGGLDTLDLSPMPDVIAELDQQVCSMADVMGIEAPSNDALAQISPTLAAWTSTLRLFAFDDVPLIELPGALLALTVYAAHWQSLRTERHPLPQSLMQMVGSVGPSAAVLGGWHHPWHGAPVEIGGRPVSPGRSVAECLGREWADGLSNIERGLALRTLARARVAVGSAG